MTTLGVAKKRKGMCFICKTLFEKRRQKRDRFSQRTIEGAVQLRDALEISRDERLGKSGRTTKPPRVELC